MTAADTPALTACGLCGGPFGATVVVREMMFGLRDPFEYGECALCGAVQLRTPPSDMSRYYPRDYYVFAPSGRTGPRMRLRRLRHRLTLGRQDLLARTAQRVKPHPAVSWIRRIGMTRRSRILDVGCGNGRLLLDLADAGFTALTGVDPYVDADARPAAAVQLVKGTMDDLDPVFDVVMFHHSLEHVRDQLSALRHAVRLLHDDGWCLVRVPIASSYAWMHYREHWVQLDAPRHFVLHTVTSLSSTAAAAGLVLDCVEYDSSEFQFLGSELYRRGRPLAELASAFGPFARWGYRRRARRLNAEGRGDQAAFYFRKLRRVGANEPRGIG